MCHGNGIHGARAGATDAFKTKPAILQQGIEDAPGERPMRATALERQVDKLRVRRGGGLGGFGSAHAFTFTDFQALIVAKCAMCQ
jgi:hypothetical protein